MLLPVKCVPRRNLLHRLARVTLFAAIAASAGCRHFQPAPLSPEQGAERIEGRRLSDPGLKRFLESSLGHSLVAWPLPRWDLETLTLAAFYFHADLDLARADRRVASAGIVTAGARPNPSLVVAPEFSSNAPSAVSPWLAAVHLDWPIETAGKRGHRVARAEQLAEAARFGLEDAAWRVRGELRAALVELSAADASAAHLERELALEERLVGLLQAQLDAGAISRATLAPRRLAAMQAAFDLAGARGRRERAQARVAAAIGVTRGALEGVELTPPPLEPTDARALRSEEARRHALLDRADVRAALADYEASQAALQLEIARQYPDVHLSTGYQFDQGENKWALGLVVDLPVLDQNQGPIAEAEARRAQAAARFESLQSRVIAEVEQAAADQEAARAQLRHAEALVSERTDARERARRALEAGEGDRAALLLAELELEHSLVLREQARAGTLDAEARLEQAEQPPLPLLAAATAAPGDEHR